MMKTLGESAGGRVLQRTIIGGVEGFKGGAVMGAGTSALNENTWSNGVANGLFQVGKDGLVGGGIGAVTGGAMANALPPVMSGLKRAYGGKGKAPSGGQLADDVAPGPRVDDSPNAPRTDDAGAGPRVDDSPNAPRTDDGGAGPKVDDGGQPKVDAESGQPKADADGEPKP